MRLKLESHIQMGLLLLMVLPILGYQLLAHLLPDQAEPSLQQEVKEYIKRFEQGLLRSMLQTKRQTALPNGIDYYITQAQRSNRCKNNSDAGHFTIELSGSLPQLYYCLLGTDNMLHIYSFNLPHQLKQLRTAGNQQIYLIMFKEGKPSGFTIKNGYITQITEPLPTPVLEAITTDKQSVEYGDHEYAWHQSESGFTLVVSQSRTQETLSLLMGLTLLGIPLLLSWLLANAFTHWLERNLSDLSRSASVIASGDLTNRLPTSAPPPLREISQIFNRLLDLFQRDRVKWQSQVSQLEQQLADLRHAMDKQQALHCEQFENARNAVLAPEITLIRHELSPPLDKLKVIIDALQDSQTEMVQILARSAIDLGDIRSHSQQCADKLLQAQSQITTAVQIVNALLLPDSSLDVGEKTHFFLAPLLQETAQELTAALTRHGIQLYLRCPTEITLYSYPNALRRILHQMLLNSLQHAFNADQGGEIVVTARETDDEIQLNYRDNGRGVAPQEREKIFLPFYSNESNLRRAGLGLYLVKQLVVMLLSGTITCQESKQPGANFLIRIPRHSRSDEHT